MRGRSLIIMLALAAPVFAGQRDALLAGNELYRAGAYEDALTAYEGAGGAGVLALFNKACALQRLGRTNEAEELLRQVDAQTERDDLAANARYNLGGASVEQARALASEGQGAEALDAYRRAARLYRDAYAIDPNDTDAARNIEVVGLEAKALLDQIRAQRQAMQEMSEQLQELQEQQEQESQESQSRAESGDGAEDQQRERQQSLSEQTKAASDQMRQMQQQMEQSRQGSTGVGEEDALERAAQRLDEAIEDQRRAEDQLEREDMEGAAERQQEAAEHLQRAADELNGQAQEHQADQEPGDDSEGDSNEGDTDQQGAEDDGERRQDADDAESDGADQQGEGESGAASQSNAGSGGAGDDEADPLDALVEDLLEKERDDRERLQRIRSRPRSTGAPVEKDW